MPHVEGARRMIVEPHASHHSSRAGFGPAKVLLVVLLCGLGSHAAGQSPSEWPIAELRQYTLHAGARDVLIKLFESEFVESQEAVGMKIVGTFRDLDRPERFVWIRAFKDMSSRAEALNRFYSGPVWKAHGKAAAATMIDSTNVLLVREASPHAGFAISGMRPPQGATSEPNVLIVANIYSFEHAVDSAFVEFFEHDMRPELQNAGISVLATYVSETTPNNYPPLPVRPDHVFVWFARFADPAEYDRRMTLLRGSPRWSSVTEKLRRVVTSPPEVLKLQPTPRSLLAAD
jgi:NIPSNAP